jgi:hypothetical protein
VVDSDIYKIKNVAAFWFERLVVDSAIYKIKNVEKMFMDVRPIKL